MVSYFQNKFFIIIVSIFISFSEILIIILKNEAQCATLNIILCLLNLMVWISLISMIFALILLKLIRLKLWLTERWIRKTVSHALLSWLEWLLLSLLVLTIDHIWLIWIEKILRLNRIDFQSAVSTILSSLFPIFNNLIDWLFFLNKHSRHLFLQLSAWKPLYLV